MSGKLKQFKLFQASHLKKIKVMTIVGTRPEIIKLSEVMKVLDKSTEHTIVHTGQNYDYELNELFFEQLEIRKPDAFLEAFKGTPSCSVKAAYHMSLIHISAPKRPLNIS